MNAPVPYFHWKPPDNTICASTRYYCVAPSLSLMSEFVGGENDQRMVIVRKIIFLCRELGERIKRLILLISCSIMPWIMHLLDASYHPPSPPENFPPHLLFAPLGFTSESHEFFMCCIKNLRNILLYLFPHNFHCNCQPFQHLFCS